MAIKKRRRWKDWIGDFLGYGRCECGKSFWYAGISLRNRNSKIKCDECSAKARTSGTEKINKWAFANVGIEHPWAIANTGYQACITMSLPIDHWIFNLEREVPSWAIDVGTD